MTSLCCWTVPIHSAPDRRTCQSNWRLQGIVHQLIPIALQGGLESLKCGGQDVQFPGLDFLYGARIDSDKFGKALLGEFSGNAQPANISSAPGKEG